MTWKYNEVLNESIRILLTIALGSLLGYWKVFQATTFIPQAVKFVFYLALPLLVVRGLGIGVDFYDDAFLWSYISIFLIIRAVALVAALVWVLLLPRDGRRGIGHVAVIWLNLTWISTIIIGIPISTAVIGNPKKGAFYGLLAGISSFIFQLPLLLLFLECHTLEQEYFGLKNLSTNADVESDARAEEASKESGEVTDFDQALTNSPVEQETTEHNLDVTSPFLLWMTFARRKEVWTKIFTKLVYNPVIWGVVFGFMLSLSTIGPTYLSPTSPDYLKPLGWIWTTSGWLGDCVSPVSLVTMGVWMQDQGKRMFQIPLRDAFLFMVSKLVLVPLMALGLAKAFDLENEAGRAAVLIAALPISLASFSLGSKYEIGESILSANVSLGTLLMLPTIIIWILVMDAADVFPIA